MVEDYFILIAAWVLYFFIHSFLAATKIKDLISSRLGVMGSHYRLLYNLIAVAGLLGVLILNGSIDAGLVFPVTPWSRWISLILAAWGLIIIRLAFKRYSLREFLGLANESGTDGPAFQTGGILNRVRHPIYSGTILIVMGFWLFSPKMTSLVSVLCILAYLGIGIALEENKLRAEFGEKYEKYRKQVPMLFPRIFSGSR